MAPSSFFLMLILIIVPMQCKITCKKRYDYMPNTKGCPLYDLENCDNPDIPPLCPLLKMVPNKYPCVRYTCVQTFKDGEISTTEKPTTEQLFDVVPTFDSTTKRSKQLSQADLDRIVHSVNVSLSNENVHLLSKTVVREGHNGEVLLDSEFETTTTDASNESSPSTIPPTDKDFRKRPSDPSWRPKDTTTTTTTTSTTTTTTTTTTTSNPSKTESPEDDDETIELSKSLLAILLFIIIILVALVFCLLCCNFEFGFFCYKEDHEESSSRSLRTLATSLSLLREEAEGGISNPDQIIQENLNHTTINVQLQNVQEIEMVNFKENFYNVRNDFARRLSDEYNFYNVEEIDDQMQRNPLSSENNDLEPIRTPCNCPPHSSTTPCCNGMPKGTSTNPFLQSPAKYSAKSKNEDKMYKPSLKIDVPQVRRRSSRIITPNRNLLDYDCDIS